MQSLVAVFQALPDQRNAKGKRFSQAGVLTLVVMGLIAQQNSMRQIAAWAAGLDPAVGKTLGFRFGRMPDYSTIRRVLLRVEYDALVTALTSWLAAALTHLPVTGGHPLPPEPVALDGKTLRGSGGTPGEPPALRVLSCLVHELGVTLGHHAIAPPTNEIGALPDFLPQLMLAGRLVTGDAHYTNATVARSIREKGGTIS